MKLKNEIKKTTKLKNLINSKKLEFIMEAHNGLSAYIVEEAGFKGIWGSGLSISAALGVRDNNEASWTQVLEVLEFMSDRTSIPILLDGDTGYGNFNNCRILIKKLEQREVAGVCIEDKLFPKTNSFINSEIQPIADIDEFCGKIKAAKDTQRDDDFCLVARTEAFIAGWGLKEALRRAEAYRKAGADAILVHSKISNSNEIDEFMKEWGNRHPIIIVPTKYFSTPTQKFRDLGVSIAIWANHNLRASIKAMQEMSAKIYKDKNLINAENEVVSVAEIFRLQGADELKEAEKKYLPATIVNYNAIILAASQGTLGELVRDKPKTLLKVNNKSLLERQIEELHELNIKDINVVVGFKDETIKFSNINKIKNKIYKETKDLYSLYLAKDKIKENTVISFGDIIFKNHVLFDLINNSNDDITIIVDSEIQKDGKERDYVKTSHQYARNMYFNNTNVLFEKMASDLAEKEINGEFIGLWKINKNGADIVIKTLEKMSKQDDFKNLTTGDLFNEIAKSHPISVKFISGSWLDVDTIVDLQNAGEI